jgi:hypothetical protein
MPTTAPAGTAGLGPPTALLGPLVLTVFLVLVLATVFLSGRIGRYRPARAAGFLRGAGFYLAVKTLSFDPPANGEGGGQDDATLRIAWLVRNDWTGRRGLPPVGVGLLVEGVAYAPAATEPASDLILPPRATAELVTCYRLPSPVAARIVAGELGIAATLRLDLDAAEPLSSAPLDVGWLLRRPVE